MTESLSWKVIKSGEALLCLYEYSERKFLTPDDFNKMHIHGIYHFSLRITDRKKWEKIVEKEKIHIGCGGKWR